MKRYKGIILCLFLAISARGQNLVPNGGFEDSVVCANNPNTMHPAFWFPPSQGSPDYYPQTATNGCNLAQSFWSGGGYNSPIGFQLPHSGRFFAGFYTSEQNNEREYLEIKLLDSLVAGKKYAIEFYVNLAENFGYAYDGMGICIEHDSTVDFSTYNPIPGLMFTAGNASGNIISDSINWIAVRDTFIAIGGEQYLILGNIKSNAQTNALLINSNYQAGAYYFVDDVSLVDCGWTGIDSHSSPLFSLYPNPSSGIFQLTGNFPVKTQLYIFNLLGEEVTVPISLPEGNNSVQVDLNLAEGIYSYRIIAGGEVLREDRLVIVR